MNDRVSVTMEDGVADVRLNRAEKRNAFDEAMFQGVNEAIDALAADKGVRAVVLSGEGPSFSAGLDLSRFGEMASGEMKGGSNVTGLPRNAHGANRAQQVSIGWRALDVPVIAAVRGHALGAGFQLALGADLRFVGPDVNLSAFEVNWGLVPDMGAFVLLKRLMREDVAADLLFTGRTVEAEEALSIGLATRICDDPHAEAMDYARAIAAKSPDAVRAAKRMLRISASGSQADILKAESEEMAALMGSPNQIEVVMARMEKRAPRFS